MTKKDVFILMDESVFNKFCTKENKVFGCKDVFGCKIACPLYRAREVEYLMNEKGMTLGDAHRASIRTQLSGEDIRDALRSILRTSGSQASISVEALLKCLEAIEKKHES